MQERQPVRSGKPLIAIGGIYKQGADSPNLMPLVPADPIQQPQGNAVMEELISDLQMGDCIRATGSARIHRVSHRCALSRAVFHAQDESTSRIIAGQPHIVVQPLGSIVRAVGTTFGDAGDD